jgi:hypothetical protein
MDEAKAERGRARIGRNSERVEESIWLDGLDRLGDSLRGRGLMLLQTGCDENR